MVCAWYMHGVCMVYIPTSVLQVALACLHEVEPLILSSNDLGSAISAAKESLVRTPVAQLVRRTLYEIPEITAPQLAEWRADCHELVTKEA